MNHCTCGPGEGCSEICDGFASCGCPGCKVPEAEFPVYSGATQGTIVDAINALHTDLEQLEEVVKVLIEGLEARADKSVDTGAVVVERIMKMVESENVLTAKQGIEFYLRVVDR